LPHPVSEEENAERQTELLASIARGLSWLDGEGGPPEGTDATWAPKHSLFLFIDDPAIADTLMLNFEQNALVLCNASEDGRRMDMSWPSTSLDQGREEHEVPDCRFSRNCDAQARAGRPPASARRQGKLQPRRARDEQKDRAGRDPGRRANRVIQLRRLQSKRRLSPLHCRNRLTAVHILAGSGRRMISAIIPLRMTS
jgi:hypothetical protein